MAQKPKCEGAGCPERTYNRLCGDCLTREHNSKRKHPLPEVAPHELQTLEAWRNYQAGIALKLSSTQEDWSRWEAQDKDRRSQLNKRNEAKLTLLKDTVIPAAIALFGIRSKIVAELRNGRCWDVPADVGQDFVREAKTMQAEKRKKDELEAGKLSQVERARLAGRAKVYLAQKLAEIPEGDEEAISASFDHATNILIAEIRAEEKWLPVKTGEHRECRGWDGKSHRCDCGNTRPYFVTDGESFEDAAILGINIG